MQSRFRRPPQLLGKRNAGALHFRELKKNIDLDDVYIDLQFFVKGVEGPATGRFIRSCVSLLSKADGACCVGTIKKCGDH